ncbi:MAG: cytochrome c-type biogenesis protein [Paracoccaceae bacterium]
MKHLRFAVLLVTLLMLGVGATGPAFAVNPDEVLADPRLEARAREISKGLRCVVCRNQSIDDSNAGIARDMRVVLRERLVAGDTDAEAVTYFVDRYGDFVLLKPPVGPTTYLLGIGPLLLLGIAVAGFATFIARRRTIVPTSEPLSDADRKLVDAILNEGEMQ